MHASPQVAALLALLAVIASGVVVCPCEASGSTDAHSCCAETTVWRAGHPDCCTAATETDTAVLEPAVSALVTLIACTPDPASLSHPVAGAASLPFVVSRPHTVLRI